MKQRPPITDEQMKQAKDLLQKLTPQERAELIALCLKRALRVVRVRLR